MKKRRLKKWVKVVLIAMIVVIAGCTGFLLYRNQARRTAEESLAAIGKETITLEYGEEMDEASLFPDGVSVEVKQGIDPNTLGSQELIVQASLQDALHETISKEVTIPVEVVDTTAPEIALKQNEQTLYVNADPSLLVENIDSVKDGADGALSYSKTLEKDSYVVQADLSTIGDQTVRIEAQDASGNTSSAEWTLHVIEQPQYPYYIRVNRAANTVTVYAMDENGEYSIPYTAFVCSTGTATPLGTYQTSVKYRWHALYGGVYGQYANRIVGAILFHSVPYYSIDPGNLESEEYNKLGTAASMGCVRLCVRDVKWIYDNCPAGTTVEFYDDADNPGPLGKPDPITIDLSSPNAGWDPTDPDPANPWNNGENG